MDKEQAKFLLRSFRPDGSDAGMPEFTDALRMAVEDRELGEWLARERMLDAQFADSLQGASIPAGLRDEILVVLDFDGHPIEKCDALDAKFIGAMTMLTPPAGLRDQILAAMAVEVGVDPVVIPLQEKRLWRWVSVAAVAAALAVGVFVSMDFNGGVPGETRFAMKSAQMELAHVMNDTTDIDLKARGATRQDGMGWLASEHLPVPKHVPSGLENATFVGCKDIVLKNGAHASLMCFNKEGVGMLHLFVFNSEDIEDFNELTSSGTISLKTCYSCKVTQFNMMSWREGDKAFLLLTKAKSEEMIRLF